FVRQHSDRVGGRVGVSMRDKQAGLAPQPPDPLTDVGRGLWLSAAYFRTTSITFFATRSDGKVRVAIVSSSSREVPSATSRNISHSSGMPAARAITRATTSGRLSSISTTTVSKSPDVILERIAPL